MNPTEERIKQLVNGDMPAYEFIMNLRDFVVMWDDAVDQDKSGTPEDINKAMVWGLLEMQESEFYQENIKTLRPAIFTMIASWLVANKFEKSGDRALVEQAYFLRCSPYEVFTQVVFLVAGFDKAIEAVEYFRGNFREDSMELYLKEHLGG